MNLELGGRGLRADTDWRDFLSRISSMRGLIVEETASEGWAWVRCGDNRVDLIHLAALLGEATLAKLIPTLDFVLVIDPRTSPVSFVYDAVCLRVAEDRLRQVGALTLTALYDILRSDLPSLNLEHLRVLLETTPGLVVVDQSGMYRASAAVSTAVATEEEVVAPTETFAKTSVIAPSCAPILLEERAVAEAPNGSSAPALNVSVTDLSSEQIKPALATSLERTAGASEVDGLATSLNDVVRCPKLRKALRADSFHTLADVLRTPPTALKHLDGWMASSWSKLSLDLESFARQNSGCHSVVQAYVKYGESCRRPEVLPTMTAVAPVLRQSQLSECSSLA